MLVSQTSLHHANLLVGGREEATLYLHSLSAELDFKLANNPDFFTFKMETFGIDEARQLKLLSVRKALGQMKVFFITPIQMTLEAQNALLKTFEDPYPNTFFFLTVNEEASVEKTLLSRMRVTQIPKTFQSSTDNGKKFISLSIKDRLLFVKKFIDDGGDTTVFLDELLSELKASDSKESLAKIFIFKRMTRSVLTFPRLALEHLSLVL